MSLTMGVLLGYLLGVFSGYKVGKLVYEARLMKKLSKMADTPAPAGFREAVSELFLFATRTE